MRWSGRATADPENSRRFGGSETRLRLGIGGDTLGSPRRPNDGRRGAWGLRLCDAPPGRSGQIRCGDLRRRIVRSRFDRGCKGRALQLVGGHARRGVTEAEGARPRPDRSNKFSSGVRQALREAGEIGVRLVVPHDVERWYEGSKFAFPIPSHGLWQPSRGGLMPVKTLNQRS